MIRKATLWKKRSLSLGIRAGAEGAGDDPMRGAADVRHRGGAHQDPTRRSTAGSAFRALLEAIVDRGADALERLSERRLMRCRVRFSAERCRTLKNPSKETASLRSATSPWVGDSGRTPVKGA